MKKVLFVTLFILPFMIIISGCSTTDFPDRNSTDDVFTCIIDKYGPGFVERHNNTQNITKLKLGMTKEQVYTIMGEPLMYESYAKPDEWFYYTDWDWADCAKTRKECTPLVFQNGKLIGWGRVFYKKYSHKDWLFNQNTFFDDHKLDSQLIILD